jgi:hypothetical protein
VLVLFVMVSAAPGQGFFLGGGYAPGFVRVGGFNFSFDKHSHIHASLGSVGYPYGGYGPYASLTPVAPYAAYNRVTVVQIYTPPPTIIVNNPVTVVDLADRGGREPAREPQGFAGGEFRPVRPQPAGEPRVPPRDEERMKPPRPVIPDRPDDARPQQPEADPKAENARLLGLGTEAFAAGEIGRAAHRFRQAIQVAPNEPRAYFLLAQANIALGKYDEAVEQIHAGLRLKPDWPAERFRPSALYGKDDAAFRTDLRKLLEARDRHPDEYDLNFLSAYLLWFEGRQDEARPLFRKAATAEKGFAEKFLKF